MVFEYLLLIVIFSIFCLFYTMEKYVCDGQFCGNVLIVGRTPCGKTTFIQNLATNDFLVNWKRLNRFLLLSFAKLEKHKYSLTLNVMSSFTIREIFSSLKKLWMNLKYDLRQVKPQMKVKKEIDLLLWMTFLVSLIDPE